MKIGNPAHIQLQCSRLDSLFYHTETGRCSLLRRGLHNQGASHHCEAHANAQTMQGPHLLDSAKERVPQGYGAEGHKQIRGLLQRKLPFPLYLHTSLLLIGGGLQHGQPLSSWDEQTGFGTAQHPHLCNSAWGTGQDSQPRYVCNIHSLMEAVQRPLNHVSSLS